MQQAKDDKAEKRQIALQPLGLLEYTVLDLAAGLQDLVPSLDTPATAVSLHFLGGIREVPDRQVRQRHPTDRLGARRRRRLGRGDEVHGDRLARARRRCGALTVTCATRTPRFALCALRAPLLGIWISR